MGQGYSFFTVTFFVAGGFVPAWLKNTHHRNFQFSNAFILVAIALVKDYVDKFVTEKLILQTFIR